MEAAPLIHQVPEDDKQNRYGENGADACQRQHDLIHQFAIGQSVHTMGPVPLPAVTTIKSRARALMTMVIRNSTKPSSMSELRCRSSLASANSLAITEAMV